jgi:SAM-dependent methyltransferase
MSNQKSGWNKIYQNPDDYSYYNVLVPHTNLGEVIEWFKSMRVNTVLDLGCGMGRNLFPLLEAGFDAYGIDNAEYGIKHIWTELDKKNLSKKIVLGKFQNLPFKDNHFDAIISIQTLNHGYESDIIQGINEIKRVLRPGGYFFITVPGRISQGKVRYCLVKTAQRVEPHTYLPTIGDEVGIPHFIFNKKLIKKHFSFFDKLSVVKDEKDYYCISGQKPIEN